jgi:hypothetical protein
MSAKDGMKRWKDFLASNAKLWREGFVVNLNLIMKWELFCKFPIK